VNWSTIFHLHRFCNPCIYIPSHQKNHKVVICTDKAVVTLPGERSIQFINTTNNTKDNKINIGEECYGVTAVKDKIYIGGDNKVIILNIDGSFVRKTPRCTGQRYFIFIGFVILVYIYLIIRKITK
jgi:hypothetical protein